MKVLTFSDTVFKAQNAFNEWAKGKPTARDVIIRTHITPIQTDVTFNAIMTIMVFYDECTHPHW